MPVHCLFALPDWQPYCHTNATVSVHHHTVIVTYANLVLGVARGPLQERPLQCQHGNVRVKSWQPMSNSRSTSRGSNIVCALGRRKNAKSPGQDFRTKSYSIVGQLLVGSSPTPHPTGSCRSLPCSGLLATPEISLPLFVYSLFKLARYLKEKVLVLCFLNL